MLIIVLVKSTCTNVNSRSHCKYLISRLKYVAAIYQANAIKYKFKFVNNKTNTKWRIIFFVKLLFYQIAYVTLDILKQFKE